MQKPGLFGSFKHRRARALTRTHSQSFSLSNMGSRIHGINHFFHSRDNLSQRSQSGVSVSMCECVCACVSLHLQSKLCPVQIIPIISTQDMEQHTPGSIVLHLCISILAEQNQFEMQKPRKKKSFDAFSSVEIPHHSPTL